MTMASSRAANPARLGHKHCRYPHGSISIVMEEMPRMKSSAAASVPTRRRATLTKIPPTESFDHPK